MTQVVTPEMDVQGVQVLSAGLPLAGLTPLSVLAALPECSCLSSGTDSLVPTSQARDQTLLMYQTWCHFPG